MIKLEEKAFERILSLGFCDTAIPLSVRQAVGDEPIITTLPSLKKYAARFEREFKDNMFSREAHAWLKESISPFMDSIGYHDNRQSRRISLIMTRPAFEESMPASDAVMLNEPCDNCTSADIDTLLRFGHLVSAVVKDGKVVSVAYTDLAIDEDTDAVEIGIETAVGYRRHGHAKSALARLLLELEKRDIEPIYICSEFNKPSLTLARAFGFELEGREYDYIFRRD